MTSYEGQVVDEEDPAWAMRTGQSHVRERDQVPLEHCPVEQAVVGQPQSGRKHMAPGVGGDEEGLSRPLGGVCHIPRQDEAERGRSLVLIAEKACTPLLSHLGVVPVEGASLQCSHVL